MQIRNTFEIKQLNFIQKITTAYQTLKPSHTITKETRLSGTYLHGYLFKITYLNIRKNFTLY